VLLEALIVLGFYSLAIPFGYMSRLAKKLEPAWKRWTIYLGLVHSPVVPLIIFVRLAHPDFMFEVLLVGIVLSGHTTGVLVHRFMRKAAPAPAPVAAEP